MKKENTKISDRITILLLTESYPPEIRSGSQIIYDFVEEMKQRGYEVFVVTTKPRYNLPKDKPNPTYSLVTNEEGVKVIRINLPFLHKANYLKRGIASLILPFLFYRYIKKEISRKPDIIFTYSPPLTLGSAAIWAKRYFHSKLVFSAQDIFPQNAVDLGILKNPLLIKFFEWLERWVYKNSDIITVHSEGNRDFLINEKGQLGHKVITVYNWVNLSRFENISSTIDFRHSFKLDSKFIILFAGVVGPSQGLDVIVDVAKGLQANPEIHFLIVGDGMEKQKMIDKVKYTGLKNISFRPFIEERVYPKLLKDVDVGLVSLSAKNKTAVVPGKLMGYMSAGLPVLAVLNRESDGHQIIKNANCGFSLLPPDKKGIIDAVLKLKSNKKLRELFGKNGRLFAQKYFDRKSCVDKYEDIFKQLIVR